MRLKNIYAGKKSPIRVFVLPRKKIEKYLQYKCWSHLTSKSTFCSIQTKTSLLEPVKNLNCLNGSGATKLVKLCTAIRTKTSLVAPVKKLNRRACLLACINISKPAVMHRDILFLSEHFGIV